MHEITYAIVFVQTCLERFVDYKQYTYIYLE